MGFFLFKQLTTGFITDIHTVAYIYKSTVVFCKSRWRDIGNR